MKKIYFRKPKTVFITAGFLCLLTISGQAQTIEDAKVLKTKTNLNALNLLKKELKTSIIPEKTLKSIAVQKNIPYRIIEKNGRITQLVGIEDNGNPIYIATDNVNAAITSGVNLLQTGGSSGYNLTGKDIKIIEWDGGRIRETHQELIGKISLGADTGTVVTDLSAHSTHVAGTILSTGIDPLSKGMAPDSKIISYDFNNNGSEINTSLSNQEGLISTHSYGLTAGYNYNSTSGTYSWLGDTSVSPTIDYKFGFYSDTDKNIDAILKAAPWHTLVRSAGNHRGEGPSTAGNGTTPAEKDGGATGYDCISYGSLPKNAIIVGAVQPVLDYQGPSSVLMTSFSSWGPTDDGRIAPTIVADGYNLYSTSIGTDKSYEKMSGTSMATPATTGAIALIQDFAKKKTGNYFSSALIKSILTNTAKEAGNAGPDYIYGFGLIDAKASVDNIENKGKNTDYKEGNLKNGETITLTYNAIVGIPFKATLAWIDRPGTPKSGTKDPSFLNDRTPKLVDDLDLKIEQNGVTYSPYKLDPANPANLATTGDNIVDNIEQIYIENPKTGPITLTFTHKGTLDATGVDYGVSVTGILTDKDLSLEKIEGKVPEDQYGIGTKVAATIKNIGKDNFGAFDVKFTIKDQEGKIAGETTTTITSLASGATTEAITTIDFSVPYQNYTVSAEIISTEDLVKSNNLKEKVFKSTIIDLTKNGSFMFQDFDVTSFSDLRWKVIDENKDNKTWAITSQSNYIMNGSPVAWDFPAGAKADDWLFTNPVILKAGSKYKVSYYTMKFSQNSGRNENLEIFTGATSTVSAMNTSINKFTWDQTLPNSWIKKEFTFTAATDGVQYIGLRHFSDANNSYNIGLENFKIENIENASPNPKIAYTIEDGSQTITTSTNVKLLNENTVNPSATSYQWTITPNTVTYKNGTNANSEIPNVIFDNEGVYNIVLNVTNSLGTGSATLNNQINVVKPNIKAGFSIDRPRVYAKENVQFTNTTSGFPNPSSHIWEITPNETGAFEYLTGTSANSEHLNVKFNKAGTYSVKYTALYNNNQSIATGSNIIKVDANTNAPQNLKASLLDGKVNLTWEKPLPGEKISFLTQDFQATTFPPTGWQLLDANADNVKWRRASFTSNTAEYFAYLSSQAQITNDYLVTPLISNLPLSYKELSMTVYGSITTGTDNLKIYYVKTDKTTDLTEAEIKSGALIFDGPSVTTSNKMYRAFDLGNNVDGTSFRLAFLSSNVKSDKNTYVALDNINISKPGTFAETFIGNEPKEEVKKNYLAQREYNTNNGEAVVSENSNEATAKPSWAILNVGPTSNITSYEIARDKKTIGTVPAADFVYIDNTITENGTYTYNLFAIYDQINKSEASPDAVVVVSNLSTLDINLMSEISAFPNPVIDVVKVKFAKKLVGKADVEIYSIDGKKVVTKLLTDDEITNQGINLSNLTSGTYVLVIKNNNKAYKTKLIKK